METLIRDRDLTILVDEKTQANVAEVVNGVQDMRSDLALEANGHRVELPKDVSGIVLSVLENLAQGSRVVLSITPQELRTTAAAEMLGISRPTLLKLVREGKITSHKVGSHHRFALNDIMEYRTQQQRAKREAFLHMRKQLDDLGVE